MSIVLHQLRDYLLAQRWSLVGAPDAFVEIWRCGDASGSEILLPTEQAVDKEFLLLEVLKKLAVLSGVNVGELSQEIRESTYNIISIRVAHPDVQDGSIPLEDGIALNANAKELISAAANAAIEMRSLYQGRPPALVSALLQNARLGQTTHGSYVIHVFCKDTLQNEPSMDFARVATRTLESALFGLKEALDAYQVTRNPISFESALTCGASANLCEAIARFSGKDRARTVEITLNTSAVDQLAPSPRTIVEFPPSHQPYLRIAADYYRQTYTLSNETIIGIVERLDRRAEQDAGLIRVATTLSNGVQRSVSVQLAASEYPDAIHAHENKQLVQVSGSVIVTPRAASMVEPTGFRIFGNFDLFGGA
ncbi:hypothetical protein [Xanthomonas theicola]|uniref:hypothetical protein n=1 Tax=Xanthomonas theicola TaxID=56464 RepID=UPI000FF89E67|nr:hypothetical protein [Xanthomonas theicola]QNH23654.1 hypothetical protein G4Q83_01175 [Xanthomonas theicola]